MKRASGKFWRRSAYLLYGKSLLQQKLYTFGPTPHGGGYDDIGRNRRHGIRDIERGIHSVRGQWFEHRLQLEKESFRARVSLHGSGRRADSRDDRCDNRAHNHDGDWFEWSGRLGVRRYFETRRR
jgi:hypothetical protein